MTAVVPVPDFSGSGPTDLCWWLCEHSAQGTLRPIACTPIVKEGPRAVPTTGLTWKSAHQVTGDTTERSPWWTAPVEESAVASPPAEVLQCTYLTVHSRNGSGGSNN